MINAQNEYVDESVHKVKVTVDTGSDVDIDDYYTVVGALSALSILNEETGLRLFCDKSLETPILFRTSRIVSIAYYPQVEDATE